MPVLNLIWVRCMLMGMGCHRIMSMPICGRNLPHQLGIVRPHPITEISLRNECPHLNLKKHKTLPENVSVRNSKGVE